MGSPSKVRRVKAELVHNTYGQRHYGGRDVLQRRKGAQMSISVMEKIRNILAVAILAVALEEDSG